MIEREERRCLGNILSRSDIELQPVASDVPQLVARQTGIDDVGHDHRVGEALRYGPAIRP